MKLLPFLLLLTYGCKEYFKIASSSIISVQDLPVGSVLPFNSAACPEDWEEFTQARGRVILGAGSGNTDVDGVILTSRSRGSAGGTEYTTGIPAVSAMGNQSVAG